MFSKLLLGKDLLPDRELSDCPCYMRRLHNWYRRTCRFGLKTIYAPHHLDVFRLKGYQIFDMTFDFEDIQHMFRLQELGIEMIRLRCMYVPRRY